MTERLTNPFSRGKSSEQERHELAVIDAAVRGAGTDQPEDAALTDFALRLSSARPLPNPGFYAELDEEFASRAGSSAPPCRKSRMRAALAGGSGLFVALMALVLVLGSSDQSGLTIGESQPQPSAKIATPMIGSVARPQTSTETPREGAGRDLMKTPATGLQEYKAAAIDTTGAIDRKVVKTAELELATRGDNVENVSDGVIRVTDKFGGYVGDSTVTGGDSNNASASFELQIPANNIQAALAQLSKLGHVRSRTQNTQDVTSTYSSVRQRLSISRARRDRLIRQYSAAAPGSPEAKALKARLGRAERTVDAREAAMRRLQKQVNFVGLSVAVAADDSAAADDRGTIRRAADTALSALTAIVAVLIVALAIALPLALVGAAAWAVTRRIRRKRLDGSLDAAADNA